MVVEKEKANIGEQYEFNTDISAKDKDGNSADFKKGEKAWLGADNRMHTAQGVCVHAGFVESDGDVNIFGVADYLMLRMFGGYDHNSAAMQHINAALTQGLADLFVKSEEK